AQQQEADQHAREAALEDGIDAGGEQHRHHDDQHGRDGHPLTSRAGVGWKGCPAVSFSCLSTSAPRLRSTSSTSPMTTRYTPMSKTVELTNSMWPITGSSASHTARVRGSSPNRIGAMAVPTAMIMPAPRSWPASPGAAAP